MLISIGTPVSDPITDTGADTAGALIQALIQLHLWSNLLQTEVFDGDAGWSGNALNVVSGVSRADVEFAGNPWDGVNLSGSVELVSGDDYTVTFTGAEPRAVTRLWVSVTRCPLPQPF